MRRKARVIGGAFICERRAGGQRRMVRKMRFVAKNRTENQRRRLSFDRSMELADQICRREVDFPVGRVGRRRDGRAVCRPHRRCAGGCTEQAGIGATRGLENLHIVAGKSQSSQHLDVGPIVWREDRLGNAQVGEELHLRQTFQCRLARIGGGVAMPLRREISESESSVTVRRADDRVEVDFAGDHWHSNQLVLYGEKSSAKPRRKTRRRKESIRLGFRWHKRLARVSEHRHGRDARATENSCFLRGFLRGLRAIAVGFESLSLDIPCHSSDNPTHTMNTERPRILTGDTPTGKLHLGH